MREFRLGCYDPARVRLGLYDPVSGKRKKWLGRARKASHATLADFRLVMREYNRMAEKDREVLLNLAMFPVERKTASA